MFKMAKRKIDIKLIALILIINFFMGAFQPLINTVFAAPRRINVYVEDFKEHKLSIRWDAAEEAKSVKISYHSPVSLSPDKQETLILNQLTNKAEVSNLLNDVVYDFDIKIYNETDGNGTEIGRGFLYFIPQISFEAKLLKQTYTSILGGGREIGAEPGISLEWSMPKVWDGDSSDFKYVHESESLEYMESKLNEVYSDGRTLKEFKYRINISTDSSKLNSSPLQAGLTIESGANNTEFYSYVAGKEQIKSKVRISQLTKTMGIDIIGRKDKNTELPQASDFRLPHQDILPGTVYYMNIKPAFFDNDGVPVNAISIGAPQSMNGSPLIGNVPYMFTPIRFQLTRDNANNLFVKIYRINEGSLDLPRLYYEVQSSDDPTVQGDWSVRRKVDDTYFIGGYANTIIAGINPNIELYYRIVVKSDNVQDRLASSAMPYTLYLDTSRPPVPMNVGISDRLLVPGTVIHPDTQEEIQIKSTDVTFSWEMPEGVNWNDEKDDLYFHIMLSTNQTDLNTDTELKIDGEYWGIYPVKYRLVKYVSAKSPNIKVVGNRITYTLKGFDLFKGEGDDGQLNKIIENPDKYPNFLLPNKIYYAQIYTTRAIDAGSSNLDRMSDMSIIKSFTTLSETEREVPAPSNLVIDKNEIYKNIDGKDKNRVELIFDKFKIDWKHYTPDTNKEKALYYDLYMSTRTADDSFVKIGTTQYRNRDVIFIGTEDPSTESIRVSISEFTKDVNKYDPDNNPGTENDIDPYEIFGADLRSNTIYYFMLKTRLVIEGESLHKESFATPVVSATTLKGSLEDPDESSRNPLAPADFIVSTDIEGNFLVSGSSVSFKWTRLETQPVYEVICTSEKVLPEADKIEYENDSMYKSFISHFGNKDSDGNSSTFILNPEKDIQNGRFVYDKVSNTFTLKIDEWLFPNRLYYFSIRARINDKQSAWVSIPVTTALIEMPLLIEPVIDYEVGFFWTEYDSRFKAEDYTVYIKGPNDIDFKQVNKANITIIRDGEVFYARIGKLKADSEYSVKVFLGANKTNPVYKNESIYTRNGCYEFDVKWMGNEGYKYEVAILRENDSDYIILNDIDLHTFTDKYDRELPYYMEKTPKTVGNDNSVYYARVKSIPNKLSDGTVSHLPVEPNTKYYVKVRAIRIDPLDSTIISYSKYIGPISLRTEFSQKDYDDEEDKEKEEVIFTDKIDKFEDSLYWKVNTWDSSEYVILLKGERIANYIENTWDTTFVLDIKDIPLDTEVSTIYIPINIKDALNTNNKEMEISILGGSWTIRAKTLDILKTSRVKTVLEEKGVNGSIIELKISRDNIYYEDNTYYGFPESTQIVSPIYDLEIKVIGMSKTYEQVSKAIQNKLYNKETGMVTEKANYIMNYYGRAIKDNKRLEDYMDGLLLQMEKELSVYIQNTLQSARVKEAETHVNTLGSPMVVKLPFINTTDQERVNRIDTAGGMKNPFTLYKDSNKWSKVVQNITWKDSLVNFTISEPGKYVILQEKRTYGDISVDYPDKAYIVDFFAKFDVEKIFQLQGGSLYPQQPVSMKEAILLYETVMDRAYQSTTSDIKNKTKQLGIDDILNANTPIKDVSRQQGAALIAKMYGIKAGIEFDRLRLPKYGLAKDEDEIDSKYYKNVMFLLEKDIMKTNNTGYFEPEKHITRGEIMASFAKALEQLK